MDLIAREDLIKYLIRGIKMAQIYPIYIHI